VLGWQAKKIKHYILSHYKGSTPLKFIQNNKYQLQNGISVLCARPYIDSEFILTMADHILDDKIMLMARNHNPPENGATLCVDYKLETIFDIDDATKVLSSGNYITKIGKKLTEYNCIDTGVFIGTDGLFKAINQVYKEKGDVSLSEGIQLLADNNLMSILDIKDAYWQDVDTPEMLVHAEGLLRSKKINYEI
jgi:choline kinase